MYIHLIQDAGAVTMTRMPSYRCSGVVCCVPGETLRLDGMAEAPLRAVLADAGAEVGEIPDDVAVRVDVPWATVANLAITARRMVNNFAGAA